jgi:hypothetical protein
MVALTAKFDGKVIELPTQLLGAAPGDVLIVYPAPPNGMTTAKATSTASIWDFVGKASNHQTAEQLLSRIQTERDSWDSTDSRVGT